jgi:uncharacterized protein (TIGR03067 family)
MAVVCLVVICAALTGCKKDKPVVVEDTVTDADRIQGTWQGVELGGAEGQWAMVIEGEAITVDGPGSQDYVGTLALDETTTPKSAILTITECGFTDYIGAKGNNLYKIEDGKLTIAGTEPGSETKPASFEPGNGTRVFEFTQTESQS